jgi:glyoxylase-like metal-dependent hydrolase (beta-lactamase superfamily II)
MRRGLLFGVVTGIGALSMGVAAFQAPPAGPTPAALAATKIEKVKDNLYMITGSTPGNEFSGGNTAVFVTATGVVVVDTKLAGWGQVLLDRIKTVTDKPVTTIINTHTHGDHTGNNEFFGTTVDSVVQENTKTNMAKMDAFKGDKAKFLPKRTFKDKLTLGSGKDEIDLYYFGAGHTGGDAWVLFPALRVVHVGDLFAWKDTPFIDVANGGSVVALPQTLTKGFATLKNVDTVIGGHQKTVTPKEVQEFVDFNKDFIAYAEAQMKAGKSVDEAAAAYKTPEKYKGYPATPNPQFGGAKANIQIVYNELKK